MRRLIPIVVVALLAVIIGWAFWPKPMPVDMDKVTRAPMEVTVDEEGKTRIKDTYVVSAPLSGELRRTELREGDPVVAGKTLLAVIDPGDPALLDARSLAEAEARLKAAEASILKSQPNLERARVSLEFAQNEYRRKRALSERNTITQQELERAEMQVRTAAEELKSAEYASQISEFERDLARAALIHSRPGLENGQTAAPTIEIRAPIDGVVLHVFEKSATYVSPSTQLLELGDPTNLEVEVDVLSNDAVQITQGTPVRMEQWGGEKPLMGHVRLIEPAAFTKTSALGVEEQRVNVIVDFDDPPEQRRSLSHGYRVEARIIVWNENDVLQVPASALFRTGTDWTAFKVNDDKAAHLTKVKIGRQNAVAAQVMEGLEDGQTVVVHPGDKIVDGVKVEAR